MSALPPNPGGQPRKRSPFERFAVLIPLAMFLFFIFGFPIGYRVILGGKMTPLESGEMVSLKYVGGGTDPTLNGHKVRILSDYLIVSEDDGTEFWIPRSSILNFSVKKTE